MKGGRETEVVRDASFISGSNVDETTQIRWFSFTEELVSNRYDFVLIVCVFLVPEQVNI